MNKANQFVRTALLLIFLVLFNVYVRAQIPVLVENGGDECALSIDGEDVGVIGQDAVRKFPMITGAHVLTCVGTVKYGKGYPRASTRITVSGSDQVAITLPRLMLKVRDLEYGVSVSLPLSTRLYLPVGPECYEDTETHLEAISNVFIGAATTHDDRGFLDNYVACSSGKLIIIEWRDGQQKLQMAGVKAQSLTVGKNVGVEW